jgi:allantoinase
VTVETCPHYLLFGEDHVADSGPSLKCAPPIRDWRNRHLLWRALLAGRIDLIASDHSPCAPALKEGDDIFGAWGGVAGIQSLLVSIYDDVGEHSDVAMDYRKIAGFIVWRMCVKPAQRFGLWPRKGTIAQGSDADIVLFDPDAEWRLERDASYTRGVDPYVGRRFHGRAIRTLVRGRTVYKEGAIVTDPPRGRFIERREWTEG